MNTVSRCTVPLIPTL